MMESRFALDALLVSTMQNKTETYNIQNKMLIVKYRMVKCIRHPQKSYTKAVDLPVPSCLFVDFTLLLNIYLHTLATENRPVNPFLNSWLLFIGSGP